MSLKKLGRYDLLRVLGKGAMGMVYEGRDPNLDRRVAIKTIKVENLSPEEAAEYEIRFRTEARSAARLQHPNIVSVYDSDRDLDIAYLVMEFIQGDDLKHHLDRGDVYTLEQTLGIMSDLLSALDYAHRQNIVHRDIKPANLLMDTSGRTKLTDFGVARIQDSGDVTRTQGSMVGTLKYMSPEQVQGQPIDARADLFAAGIVLYQLLTGKRPFDGSSDFDVIQQIVSRPHPAPSTINTQLSPAIDAVVARALAKDREARYATAQEFSAALQLAVRDAADATIAPQASRKSGRSPTWTSAPSLSGETTSGTKAGTSAGQAGSTVTQEVELVYWKDIKESEEIEDFEGFLARFPTGIYADLAQRRLKKLRSMAGEGSSTGSQSGSSTILVTRAVTPLPPEAPPPQVAAPASIGSDDATVAVLPPTKPVAVAPAPADPVKTTAPQPDSDSAPAAASASGRKWIFGAVALVAAIGLGYALLSGQDTPGPSATAPAMQPAASGVAAQASAAVTPAAVPASAPPATIAAAPAKAASEPFAAPKKQPKEAAPPTKTPAAQSAQTTPPSANTPNAHKSGANEHATSASEPGKSADANATQDPTKACEGRWFIAYQLCMSEQCNKPVFKRHKICEERRAMEQRNLELAK